VYQKSNSLLTPASVASDGSVRAGFHQVRCFTRGYW